MITQTLRAWKNQINAINYGLTPTPIITTDYPDPRVKPQGSSFELPSITIDIQDEGEDPSRYMSPTKLLQLGIAPDGKLRAVTYPIPRNALIQIDIRADARMSGGRGVLAFIAMCEAMDRVIKRSGDVGAVWEFGNYSVATRLVYVQQGKPQGFGSSEGSGRYRRTTQFLTQTWLFPDTSYREIQPIEYRFIEHVKPSNWDIVMRTDNPESYSPAPSP